MRRFVVVVTLLLVPMWVTSQNISPQNLDELIQILKDYTTITDELTLWSTGFGTRIDGLENGFAEYRKTVETVLIPKAQKLERQVLLLEIALGVVAALGVGTAIYVLVK